MGLIVAVTAEGVADFVKNKQVGRWEEGVIKNSTGRTESEAFALAKTKGREVLAKGFEKGMEG